jgi:hypothetical protein
MALRDQPYLPLYVQDYLTDEKLNLCSPAAQGVYIKIMCIFHKSEEYGGILLKQKDKQNSSTYLNFAYKLSKLIPFQIDIIAGAITELLDEKVLILDGDFLYQKRMVKDNDISIKRSKSGKKGGIKSLGNNKNLLKQKYEQITEDEYENQKSIDDVIKDSNCIVTFYPDNLISVDEVEKELISDIQYQENVAMCHHLKSVEIVQSWITEFIKTQKSEGVHSKSLKDSKSHFSRWLKIELNKKTKTNANRRDLSGIDHGSAKCLADM